jgi:hypothetical protein
LVAAAKQPPGAGRQVAERVGKQRSLKYSYDALKVLQRVWAVSGGQCGKYLAASMGIQLAGLERHGELVLGHGRYSAAVREELLAMSPASIDRYLKPAKATDQIRGVATTKPSALLRSSIKIRKAGDEVEAEPGFFEGDTVAHCGPTLKGEFARTVNLTDVHTGWVFTRTVRNNADASAASASGSDPIRQIWLFPVPVGPEDSGRQHAGRGGRGENNVPTLRRSCAHRSHRVRGTARGTA